MQSVSQSIFLVILAQGESQMEKLKKQFRFLCVVDQENNMPLFYRFLPENITNVMTLKQSSRN